jgi:hypothetical protein
LNEFYTVELAISSFKFGQDLVIAQELDESDDTASQRLPALSMCFLMG